ncbi:MAG: phenylalanine--tRNA ligase subunit alpha [Actinomycetota bacterium]|nr:phenylalanine--tRNA ligase subunit alpha [Actinomycetota bacterium]
MASPTSDPRARLHDARLEGLARIENATDLRSLEEARVRALGRRSPLSQARSSLRDLPEDERRHAGRMINEVQEALETALDAKRQALGAAELAARWDREAIDVTLPGEPTTVGSLHPLTKTIWEIVDIFVGLGYRMADGPEVELHRYNFQALNFPPHHPSLSPQETFFIEGHHEEVLLRTHTSPVQIRAMEAQPPPVYVVIPGRCYRRDVQDPTHLSCFAQFEALAVDEGITMGDLKGSIEVFTRQLFGSTLDVRMRPLYFPFTEPSAEVDVRCFVCGGDGCRVCKGEGWIEILGCGMVHPYLLDWVGYDSERYTGFALGAGIERIAALAHGVADIRLFWENDLRFLGYFRGLM